MDTGKISKLREARVYRERLFELVWAEPMIKVAERFGVSSSYLARVCTALNVPRPRRGYWAKLEVGKAPPKPLLPALLPGEQTSWVPGTSVDAPRVRSDVIAQSLASNAESDSRSATRLHPLVVGIEELFSVGRETYQVKFLKPAKRNLPDIQVSRPGLPAAIAFANALFKALERRGHRVVLAANDLRMARPGVDVRDVPSKQPFHEDLWNPGRQTVAYLGDVPIGLIIFEITEATLMRYAGNSTYIRESEVKSGKFGRKYDGNWTSTHDIPAGRFGLVAYSSYYDSKWSNRWKEKSSGRFITQVMSLVRELEASKSAAQTARDEGKVNYERMTFEREVQARRRAEEEIVRRKKVKAEESKEALITFIEAVERAERLNRAFQVVREMATGLDKESVEALEAKIVIGRRLLGAAPTIETFLNWAPPDS